MPFEEDENIGLMSSSLEEAPVLVNARIRTVRMQFNLLLVDAEGRQAYTQDTHVVSLAAATARCRRKVKEVKTYQVHAKRRQWR